MHQFLVVHAHQFELVQLETLFAQDDLAQACLACLWRVVGHTTSSIRDSILVAEAFSVRTKEILQTGNQLFLCRWMDADSTHESFRIGMRLVVIPTLDITDIDLSHL